MGPRPLTRQGPLSCPLATLAVAPRNGRFTSISLKNPVFRAAAICVSGAVSEAKLGLSASGGEDRRRKGDELRQFPEILGGGGQ
jgi:hypothetical protein